MCRFGIAALLIGAAALAASPAKADIAKAISAYRAGYYKTAFMEFKRLADAGDPLAQFNLAVMYLSGKGVDRDVKKALELHRKAAEQGLALA
jgi:TPR repeat protein